jgi:thiosulfate reductase cytochrome b subunit
MTKVYLHPLPVRIWHWVNALGFVTMIVTGLQVRYIGLVNVLSFHTAVTLHNAVGFVLIANFSIWLLFYLSSDKIRAYHAELNPAKFYRGSFRQIRYYSYGMFCGEPNPHPADPYRKFNPLQIMTYHLVMFILVPIQFVTGMLLWDLKRFSVAVEAIGGLRVVDTIHVLIFIVFVGYVIVHAYLGSLGHTPSAHFKAMFTGYEDVQDTAPAAH